MELLRNFPELRVALTFDAEHPSRPHCPPGNAERILAHLSEAGVRGTFFVQGRWASAYPAIARRIAGDGHLVGNHSHHHARFSLLSDDGVRVDILRAHETIRDLVGRDPRPWFRLPFGDGAGDARLASVLASIGYRHVGWNVDARDWEPERSAEDVERSVVEKILGSRGDAIVLLHTWPASTSRALPRVVSRLEAAGARLVGVDEVAEDALVQDIIEGNVHEAIDGR